MSFEYLPLQNNENKLISRRFLSEQKRILVGYVSTLTRYLTILHQIHRLFSAWLNDGEIIRMMKWKDCAGTGYGLLSIALGTESCTLFKQDIG